MIRLSEFLEEHLQKTFIWMQDETLKNAFLLEREVNEKTHRMWFENINKDKSQEIFAIYFKNLHIGNIGLKNIDDKNCKAESWIYLGETQFKGKGLAKKSLKELEQVTSKSLHKIYANIAENNFPSLKAFLSAGYEIEGLLIDEMKFKGKYINLHRLYKIL